jgi:hypothetical protein
VRVRVVPHCTQLWVTSSRSSDPTALSECAGTTAVIAIRCPQCGHGRRKVGRADGITSLQSMELSRFRDLAIPLLPFPAPFKKVSIDICAMHKVFALRHPLVSMGLFNRGGDKGGVVRREAGALMTGWRHSSENQLAPTLGRSGPSMTSTEGMGGWYWYRSTAQFGGKR